MTCFYFSDSHVITRGSCQGLQTGVQGPLVFRCGEMYRWCLKCQGYVDIEYLVENDVPRWYSLILYICNIITWYHRAALDRCWRGRGSRPPTKMVSMFTENAGTSCSEMLKSKRYPPSDISSWKSSNHDWNRLKVCAEALVVSTCFNCVFTIVWTMFEQQSWVMEVDFLRSWASNVEGILNRHIHWISRIDIFWILNGCRVILP